MADSVTTGSAIIGMMNGGLQKGCGQVIGDNSGRQATDKIIFCYGAPTEVITASVGSQIVHDLENKDFYIAAAQGGSVWYRLGSMT